MQSESDAAAIANLPGVREASGPVPGALATLSGAGEPVGAALVGIDSPVTVNKPVVTAGAMPTSGTILLERSFARAMGLRVGDVVDLSPVAPGEPPGTVAGETQVRLEVSGAAVVPSQPRFPRRNPGLAWVTVEDLSRVQPDSSRWSWTEAVRLDDPASADEFGRAIQDMIGGGGGAVTTKAQQRSDALLDTQPVILIVTAYSLVLLAAAFAVAVILVGARARQQSREIGLLKAIGLTPRQVGRVFAIESAALGLLGAAIGFGAGALLAPILAGSLADTLVVPPRTAANPWHAVIAFVPVLLVLVVGTWMASLRQTRMRVVSAINAATSAPGDRSRTARLLSRLGIAPSLDLGL
ncbi:MAG: ABC transporter permease, partial [Jiangellaceae bacterium]